MGIDLDWLLHWSEKFACNVGISYLNLKYQDVSNRTLIDKSVNTTGISLGAQYKSSKHTLIYSNLKYGSHAYLYAPTATSLRVDKGNALSNKTGLKYTLADSNPLKFDVFGGIAVITPTVVDTYKSKLGYSGYVGLELSHTLKNGNRIKSLFEIENGPKDTKPVKQIHDNMSLGAGIEWRLE